MIASPLGGDLFPILSQITGSDWQNYSIRYIDLHDAILSSVTSSIVTGSIQNAVSASYAVFSRTSNSSSFSTNSQTASISITSSYALTASGFTNRSYNASIGDGTSQTFVLGHNLGTNSLLYSMYDVTSSQAVIPSLTFTDNNNASLHFSSVPAANQYSIVLFKPI